MGFDSVQLDNSQDGQQPLWCFLHPVGTSARMWGSVLNEFASKHSVVALDLPGHGKTPLVGEVFQLEAVARWVLEHMEDTGRQVVLVGHSIGGMIAQILASWKPTCLKGLVLVSTMSRPPSPAVRDSILQRATVARSAGMKGLLQPTLERWFTEVSLEKRPDIIALASELLMQADPEIHAQAWEAIANLNTTEALPKISVPTLVLVGDEDVSTPLALSEEIVRRCPSARLQIIPGAGHALPQEEPDQFVAALESFSRGVES